MDFLKLIVFNTLIRYPPFIKQLNLKETDTVYEIGTGKGHLTTKLAKISKQPVVLAVNDGY